MDGLSKLYSSIYYGYPTKEAADLVFTNTPDYLGVGDIEQNRARSAKIVKKYALQIKWGLVGCWF